VGRTFEALRRAERERDRQLTIRPTPATVTSSASNSPAALWRRWLGRPDPDGRDEAELAAWLVAETRSLGARLDALDEKLDKKFPEVEGRVLHLLESAATHLESTLASQAQAAVAEEVSTRLAAAERRAALGRGAIMVVLLALLITLAVR
jgi:hypothetical protein